MLRIYQYILTWRHRWSRYNCREWDVAAFIPLTSSSVSSGHAVARNSEKKSVEYGSFSGDDDSDIELDDWVPTQAICKASNLDPNSVLKKERIAVSEIWPKFTPSLVNCGQCLSNNVNVVSLTGNPEIFNSVNFEALDDLRNEIRPDSAIFTLPPTWSDVNLHDFESERCLRVRLVSLRQLRTFKWVRAGHLRTISNIRSSSTWNVPLRSIY